MSFLQLNIETIKENGTVIAYVNDTHREVMKEFYLDLQFQELKWHFSIWQ